MAAAALVVANALAQRRSWGRHRRLGVGRPGRRRPLVRPGGHPRHAALYHDAAARYGIDWAVLAAIGSIESDHGRSTAAGVREGLNHAGCCAGPMQFDATDADGNTWAAYGVDGNGDGIKDVYDPSDAVPAAAAISARTAPRRTAAVSPTTTRLYVRSPHEPAYRAAAHAPRRADAPRSSRTRVSSSRVQRADIASGGIDGSAMILALAASEHTINIALLRPPYLTSAGISNHPGRGDISAVDSEPCTGTNGSCGRLASQLARSSVLHPRAHLLLRPDGP